MPVKWNIYGLIPKAIVWCRCSTSSRKCWMSWLEHRECYEIKNVFTWKKDIMLLILTLDSDWMVFTNSLWKYVWALKTFDKFSITIYLIFQEARFAIEFLFHYFQNRLSWVNSISWWRTSFDFIIIRARKLLFLKCNRFQSFLK